MTNDTLTNKWVYYPWLPDQGLDHLIHPNDLESLGTQGIGIVQCLEDLDDEYITIKYKSLIIRAKKSGVLRVLSPPAYLWDQAVKIKSKPLLDCLVNDFFWHHKNNEYCYLLRAAEKIDKKRYRELDISPIKQAVQDAGL